MTSKLSTSDIKNLEAKGVNSAQFEKLYNILQSGFPFISLSGNCHVPDQIKRFDKEKHSEFQKFYESQYNIKIVKFVPASGAASRMFRDLFKALNENEYSDEVNNFFSTLSDYAFANEVLKTARIDPKKDYSEDEKQAILRALLLPDAMNYGDLPKGMILFHKYSDGENRTAFEEHFHEAVLYAKSRDKCYLHFTIPAENQEIVINHLKEVSSRLEKRYNVKFEVETSIQKPSTDTPAIYTDTKEWVRDEEENLLLRPAGHGALLENLNEIDADIVFVKNIDNVVPDRLKPTTVDYKELLAGVILTVQDSAYQFLRDMDEGSFDKKRCVAFIEEWFNTNAAQFSESDFKDFLNRPLRVCGMVKNEGEPGGGPFVVNDGDGKTSLQIVEGAQMDAENEQQSEIAKKATHFNPVDLVLSTKDYKGEKFDLLQYRNDNTGMVVDKTYQGKAIKALELPGLWNGAMHYWNTIFVEVPIETFNPVKTVFDLQREGHRMGKED